jgi:hypothetical protein
MISMLTATVLFASPSGCRSIGPAEGDSFAPSTAAFVLNYRVADVRALLEGLSEEGCNVLDKFESTNMCST